MQFEPVSYSGINASLYLGGLLRDGMMDMGGLDSASPRAELVQCACNKAVKISAMYAMRQNRINRAVFSV